ncbi:MAG: hypothetical protein WAT39_08300 [Planctomycetota bacterium]
MSDAKPNAPLIDPKELLPFFGGLVAGVGILLLFVAIAKVMDLTLLVDIANLPRS